MKIGMYITAPDPISTVYFINPSHMSVCMSVYPPILLDNSLVKTLPRRRINMKNRIILGSYFLCDACSINECRPLVLPRTSCL
jgi:hypothetical protein